MPPATVVGIGNRALIDQHHDMKSLSDISEEITYTTSGTTSELLMPSR